MHIRTIFVLFILAGLTMNSCKDDSTDGQLQVGVNYTVGEDDLVFDQFLYETEDSYSYNVVTLRYYLSRLRLHQQNGTTFDLADVVYFDARNPETSTIEFGTIPPGPYTGFSFIMGLDEVMNVDGGLENTLENINMEWPIPGDQGYHYMKYEGKYYTEPGGIQKNFNLHTGATGGNQNYINVFLTFSPMTIENGTWEIKLRMDLAEWLENPNHYDFEEFGQAIMMNQSAQEVLKENGSTVFSIDLIEKVNN